MSSWAVLVRAGKQEGDKGWTNPKYSPQRIQAQRQMHHKSSSSFSIFFLTLPKPSLAVVPALQQQQQQQLCSVCWACWFQDKLGNLSLLDILLCSNVPLPISASLPPPRVIQHGGWFLSCGFINSTYEALINNQGSQKCCCYVNQFTSG